MNLFFNCPNCGHKITEEDFDKNEKILANLKTIFDNHREEYIKSIKKQLTEEFKDSQKIEIDKQLALKENEFNKEKQKEIDKLNLLIKNQEIELNNAKSNFEVLLSKKEIEINSNKQKEIDQLKDTISKLNILVENNKSTLENTILEKEALFNKTKQIELEKLNKIINDQNIELTNSNIKLEKILAEKQAEFLQKQKEIENKYEYEIKTYNDKILQLEIANATNKVIQNKTKGENFEHDVHGELLKVFEEDRVTKITSQDKKADYLQEVILDSKLIGKIVYEVKNAEWSNVWEKKLIEDMAKQGSKYGIIVATSFNKKYPGIPFKKSDLNPNIYLSDPDNFVFIGQIIRSIIKIENKYESQKLITNYDEKIKEFNNWKEIHLPKLLKIFEDSFERIKENESSILKRVDDIRIAREKMQNNALHNIREYIEGLIF